MTDLLYEISMKGFHDMSCEKWLTLWDQYERLSWHKLWEMTYFMRSVWKVVMTWVVRNDLLYEISMKGCHDMSCEKWLTLWDQYERLSWHMRKLWEMTYFMRSVWKVVMTWVVRNDLLYEISMKGFHDFMRSVWKVFMSCEKWLTLWDQYERFHHDISCEKWLTLWDQYERLSWVVRNDLLYEISMKGFHDISCEKWLTLWD